MNERSTATRRTLARTRWLSELAEALELAGKVALEMGERPADGEPAAVLRGQIAKLIIEVDTLRRAKPAPPIEFRPGWMI